MKITLSKYAGFCEGVERAYNIVERIAKDPQIKRPIFVLGSLVHNDEVAKKIEEMGIEKISVDSELPQRLSCSKNKFGTLVITAHGIGPEIYESAKKAGIDIVDTTCPKVIKVQRLARNFFKKGYQLIIIGEKNHKEIIGINEWAGKKAFIVENEADLQNLFALIDPDKKIALISQTTQDQEFVEKSAKIIAKRYPQTEIIDSICATTHQRQTEIKNLAQKNDIVIIIGSPKSANSNRLWNVAKRINQNSYFIQTAGELEKEWFSGHKKIAVAGGASTPKRAIDDVIEKIKCI